MPGSRILSISFVSDIERTTSILFFHLTSISGEHFENIHGFGLFEDSLVFKKREEYREFIHTLVYIF